MKCNCRDGNKPCNGHASVIVRYTHWIQNEQERSLPHDIYDSPYDTSGMKIYSCGRCGGSLSVNDNVISCNCRYCGHANTFGIVVDKHMCMFHGLSYMKKDGYSIYRWIRKTPIDVLFHPDYKVRDKYCKEKGLPKWDLTWEREIRWSEFKECPYCTNGLKHEDRYYYDDDGYDSPNRWVNIFPVVICENCHFFDYSLERETAVYSYKDKDKYHGAVRPDRDKDYRKWKEVKERMCVKI